MDVRPLDKMSPIKGNSYYNQKMLEETSKSPDLPDNHPRVLVVNALEKCQDLVPKVNYDTHLSQIYNISQNNL